jgi:LysR family transcriptional regulator, transcriptional activator of nhaA
MEWLNYHHLLYFWVVAREGGLLPAARTLRLSHPTVSAQIRALEERLGERVFTKVGRRLQLTETGRVVFRYADEIFTLGHEMLAAVRGRTVARPLRLDVGVVDVVPKLVVRQLLLPALQLSEPVHLVCYEDRYNQLLSDLALHKIDMVISDAPMPAGSGVRAFNHLLGETPVTFFATAPLVEQYRRGFPRSLDGAPILLPLEHSTLRRALNVWFDSVGVRPNVVAECEDSALLKVFGADGLGIFAAPSVSAAAVARQYRVLKLAEVPDVREQFWAISMERRLENKAVVAIRDAARDSLFARARDRRARRGHA